MWQKNFQQIHFSNLIHFEVGKKYKIPLNWYWFTGNAIWIDAPINVAHETYRFSDLNLNSFILFQTVLYICSCRVGNAISSFMLKNGSVQVVFDMCTVPTSEVAIITWKDRTRSRGRTRTIPESRITNRLIPPSALVCRFVSFSHISSSWHHPTAHSVTFVLYVYPWRCFTFTLTRRNRFPRKPG